MVEATLASVFLALFVVCSAAGTWLHDRFADGRRNKDAIESVRMIVTIVVTFSALVLGLLVTSAKDGFDSETALYQRYGIALTEFDQRLAEYGPQVNPVRQALRSYTAAVFVRTWPNEPRPAGNYPTVLHPVTPGSDEMLETTALVMQMDDTLEQLQSTDAYHQRMANKLRDQVHEVENERWQVVEHRQSKISPIFVGILVSWLAIAFFTFGLVSPNTTVVHVTVFLTAFSVATSLYLILDLNTTLGGFITVSSQPFRDALWHMDQGDWNHGGEP
jgi:hypothetical protein